MPLKGSSDNAGNKSINTTTKSTPPAKTHSTTTTPQSKDTNSSSKFAKKSEKAATPSKCAKKVTTEMAYNADKETLKESIPVETDASSTPRPNFVKNLESFVASMEVKNDFKVHTKATRQPKAPKFEAPACPVNAKNHCSKDSFEYFRPLDLTTRKMEGNMLYISSEKIRNNSAINELEKKFGQKSKLFEYIGLNNNNATPNCLDKNLKHTLLSNHSNFNFLENYFKKNLNYTPKKPPFSPPFNTLRSLRKFPRHNHQQHTGSISPNQSKDLVTSSSNFTEECSSTLEQSPDKEALNPFQPDVKASSLSCYTCHQRFKSYLDLTLHMIQANHYDNLVHSLNNNNNHNNHMDDLRPTSSSSNSSTEETLSSFNSPSSRGSVKSKEDKTVRTDKTSETKKGADGEETKEEEDEDNEKVKKKKRKMALDYECNEAPVREEQSKRQHKNTFPDQEFFKQMCSNGDPNNQYVAWQHFLWNFMKDKESQTPLPPPFLLLPWINAHLYSSMLNLIQQNQKLIKRIPTQQPVFPTNPYPPNVSRTFPDFNHNPKEAFPAWNNKANFHFPNAAKLKSSKSGVDQSALKQLEGMVYGEKQEKRKISRTAHQARNQPKHNKGLEEWSNGGSMKASDLAATHTTTSPPTDQATSVIDKFYKYQQLANDLSSKTK